MTSLKRWKHAWLVPLFAMAGVLNGLHAETPSKSDVSSFHSHPWAERLAQNTQDLKAYDNYDLTGSNLRGLANVDLQACAAACESDNQCQAYSFNKLKQQCSLKSTVGLLRFEAGSVAGVSGPLPSVSDLPWEIAPLRGQSLNATAYSSSASPSFDQCSHSCEIAQECVAFSYSSQKQTCALFSSIGGYSFDQQTDSGIKRQTTFVAVTPAPAGKLSGSEDSSEVLRNCDRLAASPSDSTRPEGVAGIPVDEINVTEAVPACRAALKVRPNNARILFQLGRALQKSGDAGAVEAIQFYRDAADAGSPSAMNNLGAIYNYGQGVGRDPAQAVHWFQLAAQAGSLEGMYNLAAMFQNGTGVEKNLRVAADWFHKAADAGFPPAMNGLGFMYLSGSGVEKDTAKAVEWFHKAADAGVPDAMRNLGFIYLTGAGVPKDAAEAVRFYRQAADAGSAVGMDDLGVVYRDGTGVKKDLRYAFQLFSRSAAAGFAGGMINLGVMFQNGWGVTKDYRAAYQWYTKAAAAGEIHAMTQLGALYEHGWGVPRDYARARQWYEKAADAGEPVAMGNLGALYANGWGVARNHKLALQWTQKAAEAGNKTAERNLRVLKRMR